MFIMLRRRLLVTFQYVQALLVGRVRTRVVWGAEAAAICVSYPVSTVTRMLRPLRRFDPFWSCTSICMSTTAKRHVEDSLVQLRISNVETINTWETYLNVQKNCDRVSWCHVTHLSKKQREFINLTFSLLCQSKSLLNDYEKYPGCKRSRQRVRKDTIMEWRKEGA